MSWPGRRQHPNRPGDWTCAVCKDHNFANYASRSQCRKPGCAGEKPTSHASSSSKSTHKGSNGQHVCGHTGGSGSSSGRGICFDFQKNGSCARGDSCRFSHEAGGGNNQGGGRGGGNFHAKSYLALLKTGEKKVQNDTDAKQLFRQLLKNADQPDKIVLEFDSQGVFELCLKDSIMILLPDVSRVLELLEALGAEKLNHGVYKQRLMQCLTCIYGQCSKKWWNAPAACSIVRHCTGSPLMLRAHVTPAHIYAGDNCVLPRHRAQQTRRVLSVHEQPLTSMATSCVVVFAGLADLVAELTQLMKRGALQDHAVTAVAYCLVNAASQTGAAGTKVRTDDGVLGLVALLQQSTARGAKELAVMFPSEQKAQRNVAACPSSNTPATPAVVSLSAAKMVIRPPGERDHDNDKQNFRDITITPTPRELSCHEPAYLPPMTGSDYIDNKEAALMDRQFRLIREDLVGKIKEEIAEEFKESKNNQHRKLFHAPELCGFELHPSVRNL